MGHRNHGTAFYHPLCPPSFCHPWAGSVTDLSTLYAMRQEQQLGSNRALPGKATERKIACLHYQLGRSMHACRAGLHTEGSPQMAGPNSPKCNILALAQLCDLWGATVACNTMM